MKCATKYSNEQTKQYMQIEGHFIDGQQNKTKIYANGNNEHQTPLTTKSNNVPTNPRFLQAAPVSVEFDSIDT